MLVTEWLLVCNRSQQIFSKAESTFALNMSFNSVDSLSKYSEINPNVISGVILELLILDLFKKKNVVLPSVKV